MKGTNYYRQLLDGERLAFTLLAYLGGDPKGQGDYAPFIKLLKDKWGMSDGTATHSVQLLCEMELFTVSEMKRIEFSPVVASLFEGEYGYYVAINHISDVYNRKLGWLTHYVNPTVIGVQLVYGPRSEEDLVKDLADRYPDYAPPRIRDVIREMLKDGAIVISENGLLSLPPDEIKKIDEVCNGK